MSTLIGRARSLITPECTNLARGIRTSSMTIIVVVLIAFTILSGLLIYNYFIRDRTSTSKLIKSVVVGLDITCITFLGIALLASIWDNIIVSKTVKQCLASK